MELNFENKRVIVDDDLQLHIEVYDQIISEEVGNNLLKLLKNNTKWRETLF